MAQILAASTFPEQVVEADRWVQAHPDLKGDALGQAVDQQPWDPSVKALTAFPSVLGNMDKNLSWTSSLGDAYYNQQQDVMDAVQVMRQRAQEAGNLKTTPQQTVHDARLDDRSFSLPTPMSFTSPRMIRGWFTEIPSWRGRDGIRIPESGLAARTSRSESASESAWFGGFGWGWGHWGFDWHNRLRNLQPRQVLLPEQHVLQPEQLLPRQEASGALAEERASAEPSGNRGAAEFTTVRAQPPGLSTETAGRLEDTLNPAVRAASARAPSAATTMAERPGAFPRAEAPASVEEARVAAEDLTAVAAGGGGRR